MKALLAVVCVALIPAVVDAQAPVYEGRPRFKESDASAYYVWRDRGTWHVRFTSLDRSRTFSGSVVAEGGNLEHLVKVDRAEEARNLYPGRPRLLTVVAAGSQGGPSPTDVRALLKSSINLTSPTEIVFNSLVNNVDGFDFSVDAAVTGLRFYMGIDGKAEAGFVRIGKKSEKPDALPLIFQLN
jgi:hypothetical protein